MYKNKKGGIVGIIITIIILIIIVLLTNVETNKVSGLEKAFDTIVMPIQNSLVYLKNKIKGNDSFFQNIDKLKAENDDLKQKNSELEQKYSDYESIPGYVINKEISNFGNTLIINVGQKDGIEPNMTVISDKGLVGYIISTTNNTSKVQTIIDTATAVSATISTSRDSIIVRGTLNENYNLKATYIPTDAKLLQGDTVETSGIGGIYPKGIKIGKIKEIVNTKNITDRYAIVETAVDFSKLETVLVIK